MVEGGSIKAVLTEYMRRFGWDRRNKPSNFPFNPKPRKGISHEPRKRNLRPLQSELESLRACTKTLKHTNAILEFNRPLRGALKGAKRA